MPFWSNSRATVFGSTRQELAFSSSPAAMVPVGGSALWCIAVLWSLAGLTSLFVLLRLYTRLKVVESYGLDDHFFNTAFVSRD